MKILCMKCIMFIVYRWLQRAVVSSWSSWTMYHQILEAVCFVSEHLYGKIPRRKVELFSEQLANLLVSKVREERECVNYNEILLLTQDDSLIRQAARNVAITAKEVQELLPEKLRIRMSSASVIVQTGDNEVTIWPVTHNTPHSKVSSTLRQGLLVKVIVPSSTATSSPLARARHVFEFNPIDQSHFTVGSFAMTRFGSKRLRCTPLTLRYLEENDKLRRPIQQGMIVMPVRGESSTPVVSLVPYDGPPTSLTCASSTTSTTQSTNTPADNATHSTQPNSKISNMCL